MRLPGTYALLLASGRPHRIEVGALGATDFPPGWYLYVGSARGPGGLTARLARHRRRTDKRFHWHIDYLRAETLLVEVWTHTGANRRECDWAAAALALPGASVVAPRFGASDCRCPSHLVHYVRPPGLEKFHSLVQMQVGRIVIDDGPRHCRGWDESKA